MFLIANLLDALASILELALTMYMWLLIGRAILSWVQPDPYNPIVRFLFQTTEPVLAPIRRRLPVVSGLDFSVVAVTLKKIFLQSAVMRSLHQFAYNLGH